METTHPALRDLLTIRDYLRERRDDPTLKPTSTVVFAWEVERLNDAINKAEAEAEA